MSKEISKDEGLAWEVFLQGLNMNSGKLVNGARKEYEGDTYDWSKPMLMEEERDYGRVRGKQPQRDDGVLHEDGVAAKLALEIEKKELIIMKKKLAMQSRLHPARSHSSDEEEEKIDKEWVPRRREPHHNSQMKAKRRAVKKRVGSSLRREYGMENNDL